MKYNLRFLPAIEDDLIAACNWYDDKSRGLGDRFSNTFYEQCLQISTNPFLYLKKYKAFHRCLMKHFPYAIYYKITDQNVIISGLFHCARDPDVLQTTLRNRH